MPRSPQNIDGYLASLSKKNRAALERLRKTIHTVVPRAEECISYQLPAFRLDGKFLIAFGAWANHCAIYPGASAIERLKDELQDYSISKGTIRFEAAKPLPATLVRKLVGAGTRK